MRNNLSQQLISVIRIQASRSGLPVDARSTVSSVASNACAFFSSVRHSSVIDSRHSSDFGQFVSDSHHGPLHHNWLLFNLEATFPRDPMSAGFSSPGQWSTLILQLGTELHLHDSGQTASIPWTSLSRRLPSCCPATSASR